MVRNHITCVSNVAVHLGIIHTPLWDQEQGQGKWTVVSDDLNDFTTLYYTCRFHFPELSL